MQAIFCFFCKAAAGQVLIATVSSSCFSCILVGTCPLESAKWLDTDTDTIDTAKTSERQLICMLKSRGHRALIYWRTSEAILILDYLPIARYRASFTLSLGRQNACIFH